MILSDILPVGSGPKHLRKQTSLRLKQYCRMLDIDDKANDKEQIVKRIYNHVCYLRKQRRERIERPIIDIKSANGDVAQIYSSGDCVVIQNRVLDAWTNQTTITTHKGEKLLNLLLG